MQQPFIKGDQVKLTPHGMRTCRTPTGEYQRRSNMDWNTRRGVVKRYTAAGDVVIQWEGRKTPEAVPVKILERA